MEKITNLRQLNPQDVDKFIDYSKSTAALNAFFACQTGVQVDERMPQAEFVKTLKKIELVHFKNDREVMIKHWITDPYIRKDFDKFFNMLKDRVFQDVSKRYSVPDHPPRHYFYNKDDCPTPLHNLDTGLVRPDYLAYVCSQVIDNDSEMLKPEYILELTHLALILYIYGQNCVSLHSSHIGLFRGDVFMARAILANTAEIAAAPPKALTDVENPDISEKLEELEAAGRLIKTSYSPYTTSARVVPKSRGPAKTLEFSKDSAILSYLLSLSGKQLDQIQQASDAMGEAKKELEKVLVSQEDENLYAEMIKRTNKELEDDKQNQRNHIPETEVMTGKVSRIRRQDQSKKIPMGKPMKPKKTKMTTPTPTLRITVTNIQGPEAKIEKQWENPSEEDKEQSQKLWETDPSPGADPTTTSKNLRFGSTITVEYKPIEKETKPTEWKMFPELFLTRKWAEIYDALNKN